MPSQLQSLDLLTPEIVAATCATSVSSLGKTQLWLAACLPNLAFAASGEVDGHEPAVIVELQRGQLHVMAVDAGARKAGISLGTKLNTALALAASLRVLERAPHRERACLESLANWALTLTSMVTVEPPEGLLMEVSGSIKLFRSLDVIKANLGEELSRRRLEFRLCAAPTPAAALWLARAGGSDVLGARQLVSRVGALPLAVTCWPLAVQALLRDIGIRTVGECLRLPRDGLARRVGVAYVQELDRALGREVDLRPAFIESGSWSARVELFEESADFLVFIEALELLLDELATELRRRQVQVMSLQIAFEHLHRPSTIEVFNLLEPTHDRDRFLRLIEDRLERKTLPVPAIALCLSSGRYLPFELREADFFDKVSIETLTQSLFERLREKFGSAAVYGVKAVDEHRPERAWRKSVGLDSERPSDESLTRRQGRPLWLLPGPVPLLSSEARNYYRGTLELCSGPERIESGWWDEQGIGRDYYTAMSSFGQGLWVFRDRVSRVWHLHGLFG